jgi:DNA-binding SARP family transcriptional activator
MPGAIDLGLLGPTALTVSGRDVPVPAGRQQVALAALALEAGHPVSTSSLVDYLWGEQPPAQVRQSLHTTMARVRKLVGVDAVVARGGGYALDLPEEAIDVHRFRRRVAAARTAVDPDEEQRALSEALELWRGQPLEGVESDALCGQHVYPLTEEWFAATERLVELRLQAGDAAETVGELRGLIARHPLRESLWRMLMLALAASGRQADALAAYQEIREALRDQLGVDPGPDLMATHAAVLEGTNVVPRAREPSSPAPPPVPRQVPAAPRVFAGRNDELAALDGLADAWAADDGRTTVAVLDGAGGMGKTALALHWAHREASRFPDGQLYLNLRGFGPGEPVDPSWAAGALLSTLRVADGDIPATLEARTAMLRTSLAGKRALVVLDNARDAEHVRPLLPGSDVFVVVTSRNQLRGLVSREGAQRVTLSPLSATASQALLTAIAGATPSEAIDELAQLCGRVPLALAVAAERLARAADPDPTDLLVDLRDEQGRLDVLSGGDDLTIDLRSVLSWSYRTVGEDAARVFRLLALAPGPDISAPAAAALSGLSEGAVRRLLDQLCAAHLLEERPGRRYEQHDIIRSYAAELARSHGDAERVKRVLHWYTAGAANATIAMGAHQELTVDEHPELAPLSFDDRRSALDWMDDERPNLVDAVWLAARVGLDRCAWQVAASLNRYFNLRRPWDHRIPMLECGLACARRAGDRFGEAILLSCLTDAHYYLGEHARSVELSRQALSIYEELDDHVGQLGMHTNIGMTLTTSGETEAALEHHRKAAEASEAIDDLSIRALAVANLAGGYLAAQRYAESIEAAEEAIVAARVTEDTFVEIDAVETLGQAELGLGSHTEAIAHFQRALEGYRTLDHPNEAAALHHLGQAHLAAGHPDRAREAWRRALARASELGDPLAVQLKSDLADLR